MQEICAQGAGQGIFPSLKGRVITLSDEELGQRAGVPGPLLSRFLSRSGLLLMSLYRDVKELFEEIKPDLSRVGIYGTVSKGVTNLHLAESLHQRGDGALSEILFKQTPPMQVVKEALYIPGAQLSILLKTTGPVNTFPHTKFGVLHSLEAAEIDFENKVIDGALIFAAWALDNPFINLAEQAQIGSAVLQEEAAAILVLKTQKDCHFLREKLKSFRASSSGSCRGPVDSLFAIEKDLEALP